jgi:uncharacterized protein YycO
VSLKSGSFCAHATNEIHPALAWVEVIVILGGNVRLRLYKQLAISNFPVAFQQVIMERPLNDMQRQTQALSRLIQQAGENRIGGVPLTEGNSTINTEKPTQHQIESAAPAFCWFKACRKLTTPPSPDLT